MITFAKGSNNSTDSILQREAVSLSVFIEISYLSATIAEYSQNIVCIRLMAHHHVAYLKDYIETEQDNVESFIQ